ncbi:MAG: peptide deformylase [Gammaproteobacteria bacterium]|nr:peptide deformylase [Gammaproteobacteria bacterium]MDH3507641.1 peptide deformylase [Gammaproteobacteria bacterium]
MAQLPILEYPDPRLRIRAEPVTEFDAGLRQLAVDLLETMYAAPGIGLAATQVDVHKRILVVDVSEERNEPLCLINPEIVSAEGQVSYEEGCLSVPDVFESVDRAERITVSALDENGERIEIEAEGLLAICIQHEIDHLDGKLFVDYLSALKRERLKKKTRKKAKREASDREAGAVGSPAPVI